MHSENEQSGMVPACSRFESGLVRVGNQRGKVLGRAASCFVLAHQAHLAAWPSSDDPSGKTYGASRRGRSIPSPAWRRRFAETPAGALSDRSRGCTRSRARLRRRFAGAPAGAFSLMSAASLRSWADCLYDEGYGASPLARARGRASVAALPAAAPRRPCPCYPQSSPDRQGSCRA